MPLNLFYITNRPALPNRQGWIGFFWIWNISGKKIVRAVWIRYNRITP